MTNNEILKELKKYRWYHHIKINNEITTTGFKKETSTQNKILSVLENIDFKGKRVLDIGCRDGLFSFYAEKRGASEVIAIDNDLSKGATEFLIPYFKSKVKMYLKNIYDLKISDFGDFDIVIFVGTLYHLRYPFYSLKIAKDVLKNEGSIIIETGVYLDENKRAILYCPIEGDSEFEKTSCTFFNVKGLKDSLKSMGVITDKTIILSHKIKFRKIKNVIRLFLRLIFRKKIVFGIKTSHINKYDQHIGDKVGPVTRGIFTGRKNSEIIEKYLDNYWDHHHKTHTE